MKIQGQGHDENRPKSNQAIYRSGPTIVPNIKEIQKVVQKLSREQESAAGGGGAGARRTNRYKNKVIPGIPGWLNNSEWCVSLVEWCSDTHSYGKRNTIQPSQAWCIFFVVCSQTSSTVIDIRIEIFIIISDLVIWHTAYRHSRSWIFNLFPLISCSFTFDEICSNGNSG